MLYGWTRVPPAIPLPLTVMVGLRAQPLGVPGSSAPTPGCRPIGRHLLRLVNFQVQTYFAAIITPSMVKSVRIHMALATLETSMLEWRRSVPWSLMQPRTRGSFSCSPSSWPLVILLASSAAARFWPAHRKSAVLQVVIIGIQQTEYQPPNWAAIEALWERLQAAGLLEPVFDQLYVPQFQLPESPPPRFPFSPKRMLGFFPEWGPGQIPSKKKHLWPRHRIMDTQNLFWGNPFQFPKLVNGLKWVVDFFKWKLNIICKPFIR